MHHQKNLEPDFEVFNKQNMVHVVHKKTQSHYKAGFGSIDWKRVKDFESQIQRMSAIHMVHHWYLMNSIESEGTQRNYWYCRELQEFTAEMYDSTFPVEKMKQESCAYLDMVPFYQELHFIDELEKRNCPRQDLYALQSENPKKIEQMIANRLSVYRLLDKGMTLAEISKMPEHEPGLFKAYHGEHPSTDHPATTISKL